MIWAQNTLTTLLVLAGLSLMLTGSIGLLRLPDFFTRSHATSKVDTLGIMVILLGFAVHQGWSLNAAKLVLAMFFVGLTNPVATHALARAALRLGLKPWRTPRPPDRGTSHAMES